MEYKSSRSDAFRVWLRKNVENREVIELLVELEKRSRLIAHYYNLTADTRHEDIAGLAKIAKKIQEEYEVKDS